MDKDLLLHPVKTDDFFAQYWESQPLHVSRANADHFASLLSVSYTHLTLPTIYSV